MGSLMNLAVYNPAILSDADFLASFVARNELAEGMLSRLKEITPTNLAKHHLILGQRGMGKTSLLRRLALGVQDDPQLAAVLLPLTFREEQYNVHNLHTFWMNCLDALGDWYENNNQVDKADDLDREVAALAQSDPEGEAALEVFKRLAKAESRRPLLLLDNIDLILDGLGDQDWSLRRVLQEAGGIVVVGAAAGYLEATSDPKAPFYDFFQVTVLERLSQDELLACLRRLAEARGEEGKQVREVIANDPGRIRTLYDLTGGNPRTLVLLYLLLELDAEGDVMSDLERLLDQVTVLYKARVEDLALQARVVLDALALNWNPATASEVANLTGLETPAASAQLDRLLKAGIVEKVSISTSNRAAFQLGERFFNIWYLMRHGPRRQRTRLRWLTGFLRGFYSPEQLRDRGRALLLCQENCGSDYDYRLALGEAVTEPGLRFLLCQSAREGMERFAAANGKRLEDLTDPTELPQPKTTHDWFSMGWWLEDELGRYEEAEAAYRQAIELDPNNATAWAVLGGLLTYRLDRHDEAEVACRRAIELNPKEAMSWVILGSVLSDSLGRHEEAEATYRKAIELDPEDTYLWRILGSLLTDSLGRYEEAEAAFRRAIELDPNDAKAWSLLGDLLAFQLHRHKEAEAAARRAIELDSKDIGSWSVLGYLLAVHLDCYEEAETVFHQAIELDPKNVYAWNAFGHLMLYFNENLAAAETAYGAALKINKDNLTAASNLLALRLLQPDRLAETETVFEEIASRQTPHGAGLLGAIRALAHDNFGEAAEYLKTVFTRDASQTLDGYQGFILLMLRFAARHGYGDKLLAWLDGQGLTEYYWPVRVAYDAYLHGKTRLMDVNPEVRGAAKRFFNWLDAPRRLTSRRLEKSKPKRRRSPK